MSDIIQNFDCWLLMLRNSYAKLPLKLQFCLVCPPLLQNAEEVWWKCTNSCELFFILVTFLAHDTSEILPSSISFFFPFFFTKSKEVWNICGDKCQHSDCKLQCTLLYRKYCRYLVSNFFVVKPVFVKIKNISQHEAAASFEISQT